MPCVCNLSLAQLLHHQLTKTVRTVCLFVLTLLGKLFDLNLQLPNSFNCTYLHPHDYLMEGTSFSSHYRGRPTFKRIRLSPNQYLAKERLRLLQLLPDEHVLRDRVQRHTGSIITERSNSGLPRQPFTDEELKAIKLKRKTTSLDQNEAKLHLQDTNLVNMWNSDCQTKEQWAEYDSIQPLMERSMCRSLKDAEAFQPEYVVGEKRKRVVSGEKRTVKLKAGDLEDGEVQQDEENGEVAQSIEEINDQLKRENESIRAFLENKGLGGTLVRSREPSPPASPPESEKTESSGDESDSDDKADRDGWAELERKRGLD